MTTSANLNLVSNPSFQRGTDGWISLDSTIEVLATGGYGTGPECLQVTKTAEQYSGVQSTRTISVNARGESNTYTASAYVRIPQTSASSTLRISIVWFTSGMSYISENSFDYTVASNADPREWKRLVVSCTPPSNAKYASVKIVQPIAGDAGDVFIVDAVKLEIGSSATPFQESIDQAQENAIVNKSLTKVPVPHITGMELNADIELGNLVLNTIDNEGYVFVVTDLTGVFGTPESEFAEMSKGVYQDGDYETRGRYKARFINLTGSILVPGPEHVSYARDKIIRAANLVKSGAWLKLKPKNEPVKAMYVRLNGTIDTTVVNPRGRIDFSIGLKASDPVLYEWNEERADGYSVANVYASNYAGNEVGSVEVGNDGNYRVGAIYEVRGPIIGQSASVFNYTNGDMITVNGQIRGERFSKIKQKMLRETTATLIFQDAHDSIPGDSVYVSLASSIPLDYVSRSAGNTYATIGSNLASAYANGDKVVLTNVDPSLDGQLLTISNVNSSAFTVPSTNTSALSNVSLSSAVAENETNKLFNGNQIVVGTPNNKAITYYISSRDTVALSNVVAVSQANIRNVVYRDADYLEIDTITSEVALNGEISGARGILDALIDWVKLEAGSNVIELDDSGQLPIYVERRTIGSNGIATLYTSTPHGLSVGDNIHVEYLDAPYKSPNRARVTSYMRSGTTATITATTHGFTNGSVVVLSSISREVDGKYSIANVTTNTFTVTTQTSETRYATPVDGIAKKIIPVLSYAKTNNTVSIYVADGSIFSIHDPVYVTGVAEGIDGEYLLTSVSGNTLYFDTTGKAPAGKILTTDAPSDAQVAFRYPVTAVTDYSLTYDTLTSASAETNVASGMLAQTENGGFKSITAYSRTANVATVTTATKHGYSAGDFVTVSGSANVAFNVATGNQVNLVSYTISGSTVTMIANNHGLVTTDTATIYGVDTGISGVDINGTYAVTNINVNAVSYTLDSTLKLTYSTIATELIDNQARIYLKETPEFDAIDSDGNAALITVESLGAPYDGQFSISEIRLEDNSIAYSVTSSNVAYATATNGKVSPTFSKNPERGFMYQKNEVLYYTINASSTDFANVVTGTYAHLTILNDPGLVVGDTIEIAGVSGLIDGIRKVAGVVTIDSGSSRYGVTVEIENSALVTRKSATGTRDASKTAATITASSHGLAKGDWIYFDSSHNGLTTDKKYEVKSVPNTSAFTITSTNASATAYTATTTHYWYPLKQGAYATKVFPILSAPSPTDYTFSYTNPCTTPTVANTSVTRAGEIIQQSSARMKIYYRSGWIG